MNLPQGNQPRYAAQNLLNGGRPQFFFNSGLGNGPQGFSTRLSNQQWLLSYVQTIQNTLQTCQELRELGVDATITNRIVDIVENTLRRDIPGLEPVQDEYLVEDISTAEGLQDAVTILRNFGFDVEGEFDFDQKAADDLTRKARKQSV